MSKANMTTELTLTEKTELEQLESIISKNLGTFYQVGFALAKIRDSRLYRETHTTFEDYCRDRWDMGRTYAHRLIESASVKNNLLPMGNITPINERQARPLTKLETPEQQQEAWQKAVETAPDGKVTAAHVAKVVSEFKKENTKQEVRKKQAKKEKVYKEELVDEEFRRAFDAFYREVQRARLENWKHTSKEASLKLVSLIDDLINVK
ncbi:MAG: hypothetical protein PHO01_12715 [Desulfotomaculaceae bacterium]|nr:hypothetical protein [Desulfotomaculaceae bacterium]